jgi:hypothetical protein
MLHLRGANLAVYVARAPLGEVVLVSVVDGRQVPFPFDIEANCLMHGVGRTDVQPPAYLVEFGQVVAFYGSGDPPHGAIISSAPGLGFWG